MRERPCWVPHAPENVLIYRVSKLQTNWMQTIPYEPLRRTPSTPQCEITQMGRLLAAELSSEALSPIRESSGSHCPLRESQSAQRTQVGRTQMEHPTTQAVSPQHIPSHTAFPYGVPHPAVARHRALLGYQRNHLNSAFLRRWSRGESQYRAVTMELTVGCAAAYTSGPV
jgi:hypothetical protein